MRKYLFPHQVSICICYIHYCESKGTNYKCLHTFPFSVPWLPAHNQSFRFWSSHFCLTHWLCSVCKFLFNLVLSIYHYTAFFWHQQTLEHRKRKLYIYTWTVSIPQSILIDFYLETLHILKMSQYSQVFS